MNPNARKRSLRSVDALLKLRRARESEALTRLTESRRAMEREETRRTEIRERRGALLEKAASQDTARRTIETRRYLETLRRRETEADGRVERLKLKWAALQDRFAKERAGRRVFESFRDRRARETRSGTAEADPERGPLPAADTEGEVAI